MIFDLLTSTILLIEAGNSVDFAYSSVFCARVLRADVFVTEKASQIALSTFPE